MSQQTTDKTTIQQFQSDPVRLQKNRQSDLNQPTNKNIRALVTPQRIMTEASVEIVGTLAAMDDIITQITEKPIISSKANQRISIFPATKYITLNTTA